MARILYVFPHPDDESFGPAPAIAAQRRQGHEVYLLTLTRGEATSERAKFGYTLEEMGDVRAREMNGVVRALDLSDLTLLRFPDGGLADMDPLVLEEALESHIREVRPDVVVTYPVHGISGHRDHLTAHAVVKRVYCALRRNGAEYPRRLAFFCLPESAPDPQPHLRTTPDAEVDCIVRFSKADLQRGHVALGAYETYREVVERHRPLDQVAAGVPFIFFQEHFEPPVDDLTAGLGQS